MDKKHVFLVAGGTGGHIFPALALGEKLLKRNYKVTLITDAKFKRYNYKSTNINIKIIYSSYLRKGLMQKTLSLVKLLLGFIQSLFFLVKDRPVLVVGFGGYTTFLPLLLACIIPNIKTAIYEQNVIIGKANLLLVRWVDLIITAHQQVKRLSNQYQYKIINLGNLVRSDIKIVRGLAYPELSEQGKLQILVIGGSQAASIFTKILPGAIAGLAPQYQKRIRIDQQCKSNEVAELQAIYDEIGVSANIQTFFTDMPTRLASAHLVICRSGASTIAELIAAGRPAIFVPYPYAADDHQLYNALELENIGAAWLIKQDHFNINSLKEKLESFFTDPQQLAMAAATVRSLYVDDIEEKFIDLLEKLTNKA